MKILVTFGTRPEAIKMAPLIIELKKTLNVKVCVTAQHREMLDQVLSIFDIQPDFDLDIMNSKQDLFDVTSRVLNGMKSILSSESPDLVLVHGDTSSAMSSSLAAYYLKIPIAHIEAGLRTNKIYSPFPEEVNRQLISRLASYHFAPTQTAKSNLIKENVDENTITITGNTVVDALLSARKKIINQEFSSELLMTLPFINNAKSTKMILVTGHRRENFGKGFKEICQALYTIAKRNPNVQIVYPVHLNPNVINPVNETLKNIDNIYLIEPQDYLSFVKLMDSSYIILTDSGGIQEEAPSFGKPVLLMRDSTERPEALKAGTVKLVGANQKNIIDSVELLLNDENAYLKMSEASNPYGDGKACMRIRKKIEEIPS